MKRFADAIHHVSGRYSKVDRTRLVIRWKKPATQKNFVKSLAPHGLVPEPEKIGRRRVNHTSVHTWVRAEKPFTDRRRFDAFMKEFEEHIEWIGPVYFLGDSTDPADAFGVAPNNLALLAPLRRDLALFEGVTKVLDKAGMKLGELEIVKLPDGIPGGDVLEILKELEEFKPLLMHCTDAIPLLSPRAASEEPAATYWSNQKQQYLKIECDKAWGEEPGAGGSTKGAPNVHFCVLDTGFHLDHIEFARTLPDGATRDVRLYHDENSLLVPRGVYLNGDTFTDDKDHPPTGDEPGAHGMALLGIGAATWGNTIAAPGENVAGVVGRCSIFALKTDSGAMSSESVRRCVEAAMNEPALGTERRVIVLPGTSAVWDSPAFTALLDTAKTRDDVLIVVPSGNDDPAPIAYPGQHEAVMTVGAVNASDARASDLTTSVFSQYGPTLSVVAPGLDFWSTDLLGNDGYSNSTDPYPDYVAGVFHGTCAAASMTAGVAAMLFSRYPSLTSAQVRSIIERSADKVGPYTYAEPADIANPRHDEVGFGRINAYKAVDLADVLIRDNPTDQGQEPSTGNMWRDAEVVIRPTQEVMTDALFGTYQPDAAQSRCITPGQDNYVYVRVWNLGPAIARNVSVTATIAAPSTGFGYPDDWAPPDALSPLHAVTDSGTTAPTLAVGTSVILERRLPAAEADKVAAWGGHGCVLAVASADNDYAFQNREISGSGAQRLSNNLVQRNVNVVPCSSPWKFQFLAGSALDVDTRMTLEVSASSLGADPKLEMHVEATTKAFDKLDVSRPALQKIFKSKFAKQAFVNGAKVLERERAATATVGGIRMLDRARMETTLGGVRGILSLEPGSTFSPAAIAEDGPVALKASPGADVVLRDNVRAMVMRAPTATLEIEKKPNQVVPVRLQVPVPGHARSGDTFPVEIVQKNSTGVVIGGITLLLTVP